MRYSNRAPFRQQASFLRRQFLQDGDLPFTNVLTEGIVAQALTAMNVCWVDRIYSPLVTLWVFLGQVLSADHSCRAAVARLIAHRLSQGQRPCSAETGAYCQARKRLPEGFFSDVARRTGRALETNVDTQWLWKSRRVYVYDGSSVSMPDTVGEPTRLSATRHAETRPRLSPRTDRSCLFSRLRCGAGPGDLPLRGQGAKRVGNAAYVVEHVSPRRRHARGSLDVCLD